MANAYQINAEEEYYLRGLPHLSRLLYFYLRQHMDYKTGITGVVRKVSLKSMAEYLYVEPHQGIKGGEPSPKEIRNALNWLEKAGLIKRDLAFNRANKQSVFKLCYATTDSYDQNKVGKERAKKEGKEADKERAKQEYSNTNGSDGILNNKEGIKEGKEKKSKVGNPPYISDKKNIYNSEYAMYEHWLPDWKSIKAKVYRARLGKSIPDVFLNNFRLFWLAKPDVQKNTNGWEDSLVKAYSAEITRGKANASNSRNNNQGKESLIERSNRKLEEWGKDQYS